MVHVFISLLLSVATADDASAQHILFRAPGVPEPEYRARLGADEDLRSPTAAYLNQHPGARAREQLLGRFARAQHAFLDGDVGDARRYFQEVAALLPTDDWRAEQRAIFLHALLRLAQLEGDESARDRWLIDAQYLGADVKVDEGLFPPPVLRRYRDLARQLPRTRPAIEATGWPMLLINGIPCAPGHCPSLPAPSRSVRVTFLSDQWVAQTQQVDLAHLARLAPPRFPWVSGACAEGQLSVAARALGDGRGFFGLACDAPGLNLAPTLAAPAADPAAVQFPAPPTKARPLYRSPWLWAGVGAAVVTAVAVALRPTRHAKETPRATGQGEPVTVYGY